MTLENRLCLNFLCHCGIWKNTEHELSCKGKTLFKAVKMQLIFEKKNKNKQPQTNKTNKQIKQQQNKKTCLKMEILYFSDKVITAGN